MKAFEAGQVWTYHTRPGEEASRIVVCRVEHEPKLGEVVHIHVRGIQLKNKRAPQGFSGEIGHLPYGEEALRKSVVALESSDAAMPDYENGYRQWRAAFEKGKAGVWTVPVAEAVAAMESVLHQQQEART